MSDLALVWDPTTVAADVAVEANDLARDEGLETAVLLSLFTDRRAEDSDVLPDGSSDRRGWWGDGFPVVEGDRFGSRLWLLARAKSSAATLARAQEYALEALQWLVDDLVAARIEVTPEIPRPGMLGLAVTIYRPNVDPAKFRFTRIWAAQGA